MSLWIPGRAIPGENETQTKPWRALVASSARGAKPTTCAQLRLTFRLTPERKKVDIDNLVRPLVEGLRDAGWFAYGFADLHELTATKVVHDDIGVLVEAASSAIDDVWLFDHGCDVAPREGNDVEKNAWRETVRTTWSRPPVEHPTRVQFEFRTENSLIGLLKPAIDGLEPVLGREPSSHPFSPRDWLVDELCVRRVSLGPAIRARVSASRSTPALPSG